MQRAGWSLACAKIVDGKAGGKVIGVDLLPFRHIENVARVEGAYATLKIVKITIKVLLLHRRFSQSCNYCRGTEAC